MEKTQNSTKQLVITALFAAIVYLGIQIFRIPMPAAFGTPFLHFGHIFIVLAILCLGPKYSAFASVTGLVIFDILNGFMQAIPNVAISTTIKCLVVGYIYLVLSKKAQNNDKKLYTFSVLTAGVYGILSVVLDFILSTIELMLIGNNFTTAIAVEITSIPATVINAIFTVIGVAVLYLPVTTAYKRITK